ncbi:MAG: translation elongation factor Ts [Erysipelotrichaceae bacterium]
MATITASLVKELRDQTSAGMMDCKKALTECDGDMAKAIDWLREKGIAKAAKKAGRIAAEGLTNVVVSGNTALVVEINSETDFVAKNEQFLTLIDTVSNALLANDVTTVEEAVSLVVDGKTIDSLLIEATATIGEKITLRRFIKLTKTEADIFGSYKHMGGKISACAVLTGTSDEVIAKDMAMQVASMNPTYVSQDAMPEDMIEHEKSIQFEILKNDETLSSKPENVLQGILKGRLSKALQDMSLVDQVFFKNPDHKCGQVLKEANTSVSSFVRYEVGEGIEKRVENFADEVMKVVG